MRTFRAADGTIVRKRPRTEEEIRNGIVTALAELAITIAWFAICVKASGIF